MALWYHLSYERGSEFESSFFKKKIFIVTEFSESATGAKLKRGGGRGGGGVGKRYQTGMRETGI